MSDTRAGRRFHDSCFNGWEEQPSGAKEAAEKVAVASRKRPSAAKAGPVLQADTYGLKAVPFKNLGFSAAFKAWVYFKHVP